MGKCTQEKNKVQAVENFPFPRTKKHVLRFTGYYQHFILNYVCIAVPVTKKAILNQVLWINQCDRAFGQLKVLCSSPVLWSPDFTWPFLFQTDLSEFGVSAMLSQHDDKGQDSGSSCHENSIGKESLNLESEPSRYIFWLDSSRYRLNTVPCDGWIDSRGLILNWHIEASISSHFQFQVEHRAGKTNANADTLSWMDWSTKVFGAREGRGVWQSSLVPRLVGVSKFNSVVLVWIFGC